MRWRWEEKTRRTPWGPPPEDALIDALQTRLGAGNVSVLRKPDAGSPRCLVHVNTTEVAARAIAMLDGEHVVPVVGRPAAPVPDQRPGCVLVNIDRMNALLAVDEQSHIAHVQSGSRWRRLAYLLSRRGLTLGPLPRWMMDRTIAESVALDDRLRPSPRYGQPLDHILGMAAVLPRGAAVRTAPAPRRASGPELWGAMRGAHHRAGLLTEVHLQLWPAPASVACFGVAVESWSQGVEAMGALRSHALRPAWWRLARVGERLALWAAFEGQDAEADVRKARELLGVEPWPTGQIQAFADEIFPEPTPDPAPKGDVATTPPAVTMGVPRCALLEVLSIVPGAELWDLTAAGGLVLVDERSEDVVVERCLALGAQVSSEGRPLKRSPWSTLAEEALGRLQRLPPPVRADDRERSPSLRAGAPF